MEMSARQSWVMDDCTSLRLLILVIKQHHVEISAVKAAG
jgi:hypothetical protein